MNKTRIHALQYLLVGLALCLFYSLLPPSPNISALTLLICYLRHLTIILVGGYMLGITKKEETVLIMSGLLSVLYLYIFVLIQLETFCIISRQSGTIYHLAMVMYFSRR